LLAVAKGDKFGVLNLSTGVGTVIMYTLQSTISFDFVEYERLDLSKSSLLTSNLLSIPSLSWFIRFISLSKPIVGYFLLNSIASGRPT
jgi:hypothetical protein